LFQVEEALSETRGRDVARRSRTADSSSALNAGAVLVTDPVWCILTGQSPQAPPKRFDSSTILQRL
jgi:hypothetical protein